RLCPRREDRQQVGLVPANGLAQLLRQPARRCDPNSVALRGQREALPGQVSEQVGGSHSSSESSHIPPSASPLRTVPRGLHRWFATVSPAATPCPVLPSDGALGRGPDRFTVSGGGGEEILSPPGGRGETNGVSPD